MMEKHGIQNHSTFTGKERDGETGYGYFGARYMDHELMTMWLSVDPMADKYPNISPYNYCMWNPIKVIDPNGKDTIKTPTGISISVGDGYQATPDGKYLFGDGLMTKEWDPSLCQIVSDDGSPLGGYKNCDLNNNAPWMQFAISQIGVKEVPMGENRGPDVEKYLRSTNSEAGNPWCASFVNWCLQQSGYSGAGAQGNEYKTFGVPVNSENPPYGSIAIFKTGHVGFFSKKVRSGQVEIIHGNWSNRVCRSIIEQENIQCYRFPFQRSPVIRK